MIFIKKIMRFPFDLFWSREDQLHHQQKANKFSTTMNKSLRERLFSFMKRHKKLILVVLISLLVFFSFYQVSLAVVDAAAELYTKKLTIGKTMFFLAMIPLLAMAFFEIAEGLLLLTTTPAFFGGLDFSMANPIIDLGWTVVRDFVNMFFILILVIIGLGIALRLKEYDIKKSLPKFIAAVLLVNFGPVLLALIAEIAETFMNFFLAEVRGLAGFAGLVRVRFWAGMGIYVALLVALSVALFLPGGWLAVVVVGGLGIGLLAELLALTLFSLIAGIIFIMFAFLLFARQVAIWILIIISPIAFLLWALPSTHGTKIGGYATMWWQQFIQWSFIGIPAAFFLYLAAHLAGTPMPGLASIYQLLVVIIFLLIGFIITLKTGPMGASFVASFAFSSTKRAAGFTGQRALERVAPELKQGAIEHAKEIERRAAAGSRGAKVQQFLGAPALFAKMAGEMDKVIQKRDQRKMSALEGIYGKDFQKANRGDVDIDPKDKVLSAAILQRFSEIKDSKEQNQFLTRLSPQSTLELSKIANEKQRENLIIATAISNPNLAFQMVQGSKNKFNETPDGRKITDPVIIRQNIYKGMDRERFSNLSNIDNRAFNAVIQNDRAQMVNAIQDGLDKNPELLRAIGEISPENISKEVEQVLKDKGLMGYLKQPKQSSKTEPGQPGTVRKHPGGPEETSKRTGPEQSGRIIIGQPGGVKKQLEELKQSSKTEPGQPGTVRKHPGGPEETSKRTGPEQSGRIIIGQLGGVKKQLEELNKKIEPEQSSKIITIGQPGGVRKQLKELNKKIEPEQSSKTESEQSSKKTKKPHLFE